MPASDDKLVVVRSVPTELHAAMLVSRLAGDGIEAWSEGGLASGFRAEAPGSVNVLVRREDLERATSCVEAAPADATPAIDHSGRPSRRARRALWIVAACIVLLALACMWAMAR